MEQLYEDDLMESSIASDAKSDAFLTSLGEEMWDDYDHGTTL